MDEPWSLVFKMEGAEDPEKPVTFVCSGYMGRGERLAQLREQASVLAEQGRDIVLDLAHVTGMDSVGLGAVIALKVKVNKQGHTCVLRNPSAWVMESAEGDRGCGSFRGGATRQLIRVARGGGVCVPNQRAYSRAFGSVNAPRHARRLVGKAVTGRGSDSALLWPCGTRWPAG